MATVNQLIRKPRKPKVRKTDVPALEKSPQRRGVCTRVYTHTPKKPSRVVGAHLALVVRKLVVHVRQEAVWGALDDPDVREPSTQSSHRWLFELSSDSVLIVGKR